MILRLVLYDELARQALAMDRNLHHVDTCRPTTGVEIDAVVPFLAFDACVTQNLAQAVCDGVLHRHGLVRIEHKGTLTIQWVGGDVTQEESRYLDLRYTNSNDVGWSSKRSFLQAEVI